MNAISFRRNPASVAEMLAILADRMAMEVPKTDAELAIDYPEDDADDDAKWDDRDPEFYSDERIMERVEATAERRGFMKIG